MLRNNAGILKLTVLTLILMVSFALPVAADSHSAEEQIVILHTTDEHGTIENFGKVAYQVEMLREKYDNVYLFNGGDIFSGDPVVDHFDPPGQPIVELMNALQYDLMVMGNHAVDYGQDILAEHLETMDFPMLAANMTVGEDAGIPQLDAYATFTTEAGTVIKVLGLTEVRSDTMKPSADPRYLGGLEFTLPVDAALEYQYLADESDVFLGLLHAGDTVERAVAEQMEGMHALMGGHTHPPVEGDMIGDTLYTRAGAYQENLGKVEITLVDGEVTDVTSQLIPVDEIPYTSVAIEDMIAGFYEELDLDEVIAVAEYPVYGDRYERDKAPERKPEGLPYLGALVTDAVRDRTNADIAFYNIGSIRIPKLEGEITIQDIFELDPWSNTAALIDMYPEQIRSFVHHSTMRRIGEDDPEYVVDVRVSGIEYTVVVEDDEIQEIILEDYDGNLLDEDKRYTVAFNDYLGLSGAYEFDYDEEYAEDTYRLITDLIIDYLSEMEPEDFDYEGVLREHIVYE